MKLVEKEGKKSMKKSCPEISIILPIYNVEKYLDNCMDSLFNQTYSNFEVIMVDDGSTDGCADICNKYMEMDKRVRVYHKKNGGLSDARNFGIEKAMKDYITCIDPDDYVDEDYLEYLVFLISKYETKMAICQHRVVFDNGKIRDYGANGDEMIESSKCIERMLYHDIIDTSAWGKLYHKSLFDNVQYPKGKIFEDIGTTYLLMLQCEKIAVGYQSKYNYIFHDNSIVNSKFKISKLDMIEMTDKMATDVLQKYPDMKDAVMSRRVYSRISTLNQMINEKGYLNIKKQLMTFIYDNAQCVLKNKKVPKRDKIAICLLRVDYNLYKIIWKIYRK